MSEQPDLHLLVELENEVARWRRRAVFFFSVILHGLMALLLAFSPNLLRRGAQLMGIPLEERKAPREYSYLWLPPDVLRRLQEPPPETRTFSDRDRRAAGRSPVIDPEGIRMPFSPGNTPLPEIPGGMNTPPAPPPPSAAAPSGSAANPGEAARTPAKKDGEGLELQDVNRDATGSSSSRLQLPSVTTGEAIQESLQAAIQGRAGRSSGPGGPGDSPGIFQNYHPNFSTEEPLILSDTMGVDFGPYLARVVFVVRRNWYAVIPESARLGQRGRVALVFEILKDGSVPELRLVSASGADALDRAAVAAIRASIPFAPLPEEFQGRHLVLQFIFLYNMTLP